MSDRQHWRACYSRWLDESLVEYNARFDPRLWHQQTVPEDYDPGDLVEIAESGDVYPHGIGGTNHISKVVTPWSQSVHYIP